MQIKLLFRLISVVLPFSAAAQSSYIRTGDADYRFLDRLEIRTRSAALAQSFARPYARAPLFAAVDSMLKDPGTRSRLTAVDRYHAEHFLDDPEYNNEPGTIYGRFTDGWRNKRNTGFSVITPILRTDLSKESNNSYKPFLSTVGIAVRAAHKKIGFSFYATYNRERIPVYLNDWLSRYNTVPGAGSFDQGTNRRVTYWDVRGTVQTSVTKYIDLQVGYDRNFLGNGYRSLFLSDFSNNTAFFKMNVKLWKLNFQSLYMQLKPQYGIVNSAGTKKYLRLNTLGIDVSKWLNISFFDAVVLGRKNGFDLNYILPVTFLRAMEQQSGSPDNALFGMNVKANLAGKIQLYGQVLLDEFKLSEIKAQSGWWANKYGYQLGVKYIDALGIKNLDLQVETNRVRPFTYTHFDSVSNYTHYNQPLAHPLGANFQEFIGILHYQPTNRLQFHGKVIWYKQGLDSSGYNMGNNVLASYNNRPRNYGWEVGSGNKATCLYVSGVITYEIAHNTFMEISATRRKFTTQLSAGQNTTMVSVGIRWNISRREFDF
jgi:hypothetical protein